VEWRVVLLVGSLLSLGAAMEKSGAGGLVAGWLERRAPGEGFVSFARRASDEELGELAGLEPAKSRAQREEEAA